MKPRIDLGFIALTDAAPLIVARARGEFEAEGLDVLLHREVSWATVRDKVAAGVHQGAHMLAPLAIATTLGVGAEQAGMIVPMALNSGGASLGVSAQLAAEMEDLTPSALAAVVAARKAAGKPMISFAVVFPYSMHNYMLRFWAASAGIDPDVDLRITAAPPISIASRLRTGEIDGFCVGAPWSLVCQAESGAQIALESSDFWPCGPDKVLVLSRAWGEHEPQQSFALMRAIARAAKWADDPANRGELVALLCRREWLDVPPNIIGQSLGQIRFARDAALHPWKSQAAWIGSQMLRWGQIDADRGAQATDCYRPDLFRAIARDVGLDAPMADSKTEGAHAQSWPVASLNGQIDLPPDRIFGGSPFDPEAITAYAASFAVTRVSA